MKLELDTDEWISGAILVLLVCFILGVVGPCVTKYGLAPPGEVETKK